jgi:hypothetical protein
VQHAASRGMAAVSGRCDAAHSNVFCNRHIHRGTCSGRSSAGRTPPGAARSRAGRRQCCSYPAAPAAGPTTPLSFAPSTVLHVTMHKVRDARELC